MIYIVTTIDGDGDLWANAFVGSIEEILAELNEYYDDEFVLISDSEHLYECGEVRALLVPLVSMWSCEQNASIEVHINQEAE